MELERLLRSQGFGSRSECRALILNGKVSVEGVACEDPCAKFEPEGVSFAVNDEIWNYRKFAYLMLNKPGGYECSQKPIHHPSVYSLLPRALLKRGVQAVGRLDENTTGLLLLTDDGQFIHTYTSPKKKIAKVYDATVKHPVDEVQVAALLEGVQLKDETTSTAAVNCEIRSERVVRITVTEGKYHLVRRMVAAAGNRVEELNRVSIGGLSLPNDLPVGQWKWLEATDLEHLMLRSE